MAGSCSGLTTTKLCVVRYHPEMARADPHVQPGTQGGLQPDLQAGELIIGGDAGPDVVWHGRGAADQKIIVAGTCSNLIRAITTLRGPPAAGCQPRHQFQCQRHNAGVRPSHPARSINGWRPA